jgi:hypothetical protein
MKSAGFADVIAETVTTEMRPNSVADFVSFLRDSGGGPSPMLAKADDTTKEAVWAAIVEALSPFEEDDECVFPGDILVAVATRP